MLADAVTAAPRLAGARRSSSQVSPVPASAPCSASPPDRPHPRTAACWCPQATQAEAGLPFAVLHRLLQPILRQADQLPAVQREALHTAFALQAGPAPDPFLVALGTLSLLTCSAADRPVVAVVDNLQWLDKASAEILTFVARRVSDVPLMLLGGLRQGHPAAAFDMSFRQLTVGRLDRASARLLLKQDRCRSQCGATELDPRPVGRQSTRAAPTRHRCAVGARPAEFDSPYALDQPAPRTDPARTTQRPAGHHARCVADRRDWRHR